MCDISGEWSERVAEAHELAKAHGCRVGLTWSEQVPAWLATLAELTPAEAGPHFRMYPVASPAWLLLRGLRSARLAGRAAERRLAARGAAELERMLQVQS